MAKTFAITTIATDTLKPDAKGHADAVYTVTNTASRPIRGMAKVKALGDTKKDWLSIGGETERDFGGGATEQFTVNFDATGAPAGKYSFRLDVASALNPDEDFTEGPPVAVELAGLAPVVAPKKGFPMWVIPVIAVVLLLVIGLVVWLLWPKPKLEAYVLPDVANASESDARQRLESECTTGAECVTVDVSPVSDNTVAKGMAIGTEPAAGTEVPAGSNVTLFISTGSGDGKTFKIPAIANVTEEKAKQRFDQACPKPPCAELDINRVADNKAAGMVIRTEPKEGSEVAVGSKVTMFVSKGPEKVTIQDVSNKLADSARDILEKSCSPSPCLDVEVTRIPDKTVGEGKAIRTEPKAGTQVNAGSKVSLFVSGGTDEVGIPRLRNRPIAEARKRLEGNCKPGPCLRITEQKQSDESVPNGMVISTTPGLGSLKIGSTIVVTVSTGPEPKLVGNYMGLSEKIALQKIKADGFMVGGIKRTNRSFLTQGVVSDQDPKPQSKLAKGSKINLTISGGM